METEQKWQRPAKIPLGQCKEWTLCDDVGQLRWVSGNVWGLFNVIIPTSISQQNQRRVHIQESVQNISLIYSLPIKYPIIWLSTWFLYELIIEVCSYILICNPIILMCAAQHNPHLDNNNVHKCFLSSKTSPQMLYRYCKHKQRDRIICKARRKLHQSMFDIWSEIMADLMNTLNKKHLFGT